MHRHLIDSIDVRFWHGTDVATTPANVGSWVISGHIADARLWSVHDPEADMRQYVYSITSSARSRKASGIVSPMALAVFRLNTSL